MEALPKLEDILIVFITTKSDINYKEKLNLLNINVKRELLEFENCIKTCREIISTSCKKTPRKIYCGTLKVNLSYYNMTWSNRRRLRMLDLYVLWYGNVIVERYINKSFRIKYPNWKTKMFMNTCNFKTECSNHMINHGIYILNEEGKKLECFYRNFCYKQNCKKFLLSN